MDKRTKPVKVPVILQMEALECGAASLAMILAYYRKWISLEEARVACGVSRDGSIALNIVKAAQGYGLQYKAYWYDTEKVLEKANFPAILFWNRSHFVVLKGIKKGCFYINDPAVGSIRLSREDFDRYYSGLCIEFTPGENFVAEGKPKSAFDYLKGIISGNKGLVFFVMITGALTMAAGSLMPVITRIYTDEILNGDGGSWYHGFLWFFAGLILLQFIASSVNLI